MKKLFIKGALLCTALFFTVQADAQISLGNILKNVVSGGSSEKTTTETTSSDNSGVGGLLSSLTSIFSSNKVATEDKNIVLKYGGKISQIVGTTQLDGDNLLIVMNASKLLEYVNVLGSVSQNSTLKTAASLIGGMDGLECGLKLVKQ